MRVLSLLLLLVLAALVGLAAAMTGEVQESGLVDFESEVGPYETDMPAFLESDADAEVDAEADAEAEAEAEVDTEADAETDAETDVDAEADSFAEVQASCGTGGTCRARSSCSTSSNTILTGKCAGAANIICCVPRANTGSTTPPRTTPATGSAFQTTSVARAGTWVTAKLRYCQAPRGGRDASDSCPRTCVRQANPAWDAYRSDCSGLVSFAWGLPAPGVTTRTLATVSRAVNCNTMQPGDAINRAGSHTMLFVRWTRPGTQAVFYEEPGCSMSEPWARAVTLDLTCSGTNVRTARRGAFIAVRKNGQ